MATHDVKYTFEDFLADKAMAENMDTDDFIDNLTPYEWIEYAKKWNTVCLQATVPF